MKKNPSVDVLKTLILTISVYQTGNNKNINDCKFNFFTACYGTTGNIVQKILDSGDQFLEKMTSTSISLLVKLLICTINSSIGLSVLLKNFHNHRAVVAFCYQLVASRKLSSENLRLVLELMLCIHSHEQFSYFIKTKFKFKEILTKLLLKKSDIGNDENVELITQVLNKFSIT